MSESFKDFYLNSSGIYVAARVSKSSQESIEKYILANKIPVPTDNPKEARKHCTIVFSRKYAPVEVFPTASYTCLSTKLDVFISNGKNCLVLKLNCPEISKRHSDIYSQNDLTYDFPTYIPHVTLSYDIGNFDWQKLPPFVDELILDSEYKESLKE
jgi:hypothetical protein